MNHIFSITAFLVFFGTLALGVGVFFIQEQSYEVVPILIKQKNQTLKSAVTLPIKEKVEIPNYPYIDLCQEFAVFKVPENAVVNEALYLLLAKKSGQTKIVKSGDKVCLDFSGLFSQKCEFDLHVLSDDKKVDLVFKSNEQVFDIVQMPIQELACKSLGQINPHSKIAKLLEIQWIGQDLFQKKFLPVCLDYRLSVKSDLVQSVTKDEFICLKKGVFSVEKTPLKESDLVAEVVSIDEKTIQLLVFTKDEIAKILVQPTTLASKPQNTDFITSVRIRSENQVSCFIDKQPFVLKTGDIVFKKDAKWKALRTIDEKQALMTGVLDTEVFVFDRIESKNSTQYMCGYFFNKNHSEKIFLEMPSLDKKKSSKLDRGK